ncbi:CTSL [Mytilus edulis]|uniref:CTSL n=1 Tax=Mytilus edulis TaxID=6550 RepID=A0A8S3RND9_MYTED|nr:CTSL [Mytilus edulis]
MKIKLFLTFVCFEHALAGSLVFTPAELDNEWELFKTSYNKIYSDNVEDLNRRQIWEDNVRFIEHHNMAADRGEHSFWLGINHLADMSLDEVSQMMTQYGNNRSLDGSTYLPPSNVNTPEEVDWRKQGYVTPVKNQGHCGSCWSFAATGSLEGQHFRKTGKLVSLSEQNLVDCSSNYGNKGCHGGYVSKAYQYIKDNGGIDTESSYPYEATDDNCRFKENDVGATAKGFTNIKSGDEKALQSAVATVGPIAVGVDVKRPFQFYRSGIFDDPTCSSVTYNHGVLVVGYGTENGQDYWLVKNSWSAFWGMDGYIKMSRNKNNQCAIATDALYPLV